MSEQLMLRDLVAIPDTVHDSDPGGTPSRPRPRAFRPSGASPLRTLNFTAARSARRTRQRRQRLVNEF